MSTPDIVTSLQRYRPDPAQDATLATLGYAAAHGWPDQRPITADLVASRLRSAHPSDHTLLALAHRGADLVAWAAIRPAPPGGNARLWGPIVRPDHQRRGLGGLLLDELGHGGLPEGLLTAEIPAARTHAHRFFTRRGWRHHSRATVLHGSLTTPATEHAALMVTDATRHPGLATVIGALYAATFPDHGPEIAARALDRWAADRRYRAEHLLVARNQDDAVGAVLLYQLDHIDRTEPSELLIADLLHATVPADLVLAAVAPAITAILAATGSRLRAVTAQPGVRAALIEHGMTVTDHLDYFTHP